MIYSENFIHTILVICVICIIIIIIITWSKVFPVYPMHYRISLRTIFPDFMQIILEQPALGNSFIVSYSTNYILKLNSGHWYMPNKASPSPSLCGYKLKLLLTMYTCDLNFQSSVSKNHVNVFQELTIYTLQEFVVSCRQR